MDTLALQEKRVRLKVAAIKTKHQTLIGAFNDPRKSKIIKHLLFPIYTLQLFNLDLDLI